MLSSNYYGELSTLDLDKYWISPSLVNDLDKGMRPVEYSNSISLMMIFSMT